MSEIGANGSGCCHHHKRLDSGNYSKYILCIVRKRLHDYERRECEDDVG